MRHFHLQQGPETSAGLAEAEVAALLASGGLTPDLPCRLAGEDVWRTVGDFFPSGAGLKIRTAKPRASEAEQISAANRIDDAFVVVSTGGYADIPVRYENQEVGRTDRNGHLLVPYGSGYYRGKYEIDPMNLPPDILAAEVEQRVAVRRGSGTNDGLGQGHENDAMPARDQGTGFAHAQATAQRRLFFDGPAASALKPI